MRRQREIRFLSQAINAKNDMVRERYVPKEFYTGREFEYDLFDEVNVSDPAFRRELAAAVKDAATGYVTFHKAVELAKKFQPADPANPQKDFFRELRIAVADKMGLRTEKEADAVGAYTAIKSPLDIFHGVDAFVSYKPNGKEFIVTLDATMRGDKTEEEVKADVVIKDIPDMKEAEGAYLSKIEAIAEQIVAKIRVQETTPPKRPPESPRVFRRSR